MSIEDLTSLENDHPEDARLFIKLVLKSMFCSFSIINNLPNLSRFIAATDSKIDQDVLLTNLAQFRM